MGTRLLDRRITAAYPARNVCFTISGAVVGIRKSHAGTD